jgi:hypothetical protein
VYLTVFLLPQHYPLVVSDREQELEMGCGGEYFHMGDFRPDFAACHSNYVLSEACSKIAQFAHVIAIFADYPPKCAAGVRERAAECAFWVGGMFGCIRRNDTNAADARETSAAVQFVHFAAVVAMQNTFYRRQKQRTPRDSTQRLQDA